MPADHVVFLFDVDNTLLDNDRIVADLMSHLESDLGHEHQRRYWEYFEQIRLELGYADYLGALQRYRINHPRDFHIVTVSYFMLHYHLPTACSPVRSTCSNGSNSSARPRSSPTAT